MVFEFQINNTILNYLTELIEQDWGVIACFTCKNSCSLSKENPIQEEFAFL